VDIKTNNNPHTNGFEKKILRKIFGPTYENGFWRIKTDQELDKTIKTYEHNKLRQSTKMGMVWLY
jgi:hypothetical protein